MYLASKPDTWRYFMEEIKENATDGITSLKSAVKELEELNYLIREKDTNELGHFIGWIWILTMPDRQVFHQSENPTGGKPDRWETCAYSNTNSSNTKNSNTDSSKSTCDSDFSSFENFWEAYDKKIDRSKAEKKWNKLKKETQQEIMDFIPYYKEYEPDPQYRKNPVTFLNNRTWDSEFIVEQVKNPKPKPASKSRQTFTYNQMLHEMHKRNLPQNSFQMIDELDDQGNKKWVLK